MMKYAFTFFMLVSSLGRGAIAQEFECLLGRNTWFGNLKVELRVNGSFDQNQRLGRVKIARLPGAPSRYGVVKQSKIDPSSANMLSLELAREDGAAYYEVFIAVSNQRHLGSQDGFTVQDASPRNFFKAKFLWRDLFNDELSGVGVCYIS